MGSRLLPIMEKSQILGVLMVLLMNVVSGSGLTVVNVIWQRAGGLLGALNMYRVRLVA